LNDTDAAFEVKTDKYYGKIGDGGEVDTKGTK